jgi:hypothetical protein
MGSAEGLICSTPQGVEVLAELVLAIQHEGLLDAKQPVYVVGGTFETGWPIDPAERLTDCVIAAVDLGMFEPLVAIDPDRDRPRPAAKVLPDGSIRLRTAPGRSQVTAFRRAAHNRSCQPPTDPPRSIHEQFLLDWDCFLGAIVDVLTDELHELDLIDKNHPG